MGLTGAQHDRGTELTVADAPASSQFEARLPDGTLVGLAQYALREDAILFTHTEVPEQYEGQGIAARMVRFALDDVRARGLRVVALCPYVRAYIRRHPDEYGDLVGQRPRREEA
jgi:predicted GNAT family acetyltransferase